MKRSVLPLFFVLCIAPSAQGASSVDTLFEITSHCARIHLFPSEGAMYCSDTLEFRIVGEKKSTLTFGLSRQNRIEQILLNGELVQAERSEEAFTIDGSRLERLNRLVVEFTGRGTGNPEISRLTPERALLHENEILVRGFRAYEFVRLTIVVPRQWTAIAVGSLESTRELNDSREFVWVSRDRIPTVGWISAGKYVFTSLKDGPIEFSAYLFERDSARAQPLLASAERLITFYSRLFTPYRFAKLAIVEIDDWLGGPLILASAIPSIILIKQAAFTASDEFDNVNAVLPHEAAHQWWPQAIPIREEDAAFLSEGLCEYAARIYDESFGLANPRSDWKSHPYMRALVLRAIRGREVPLNRATDIRTVPTHYLKASYVHHMLRGILGDSTSRQLYREFALRYSSKTTGLKEFEALADEVSGKALDWFFTQWVRETGMPRLKLYNVEAVSTGTEWTVRGRIRLAGYKSYTMPVTIGVTTTQEVEKTSVWLGRDDANAVKNDLPFEVRTSSKPLRVDVDPEGDLLKIQKMPVRLSELREPAMGVMIVGTRRLAEQLLEAARRDSAELQRHSWSIRIKPDTASTLSDYRAERVFIYGSPSMNSVAARVGKRFPVSCDDGRCVWNEKVYVDTTLALTQIIENPFQDQSLLCWLVPLGNRAEPMLRLMSASVIVARHGEVVESWTWDVRDEDLSVELDHSLER
jgi:hypothetical protein